MTDLSRKEKVSTLAEHAVVNMPISEIMSLAYEMLVMTYDQMEDYQVDFQYASLTGQMEVH